MNTGDLRKRASVSAASYGKDNGQRKSFSIDIAIPTLPTNHAAAAAAAGHESSATQTKLKKGLGPDGKPVHIYRVLLKTGKHYQVDKYILMQGIIAILD